ncbi:hypothetical protein AKJ16_DCAP01347 [Drosera capensis]
MEEEIDGVQILSQEKKMKKSMQQDKEDVDRDRTQQLCFEEKEDKNQANMLMLENAAINWSKFLVFPVVFRLPVFRDSGL